MGASFSRTSSDDGLIACIEQYPQGCRQLYPKPRSLSLVQSRGASQTGDHHSSTSDRPPAFPNSGPRSTRGIILRRYRWMPIRCHEASSQWGVDRCMTRSRGLMSLIPASRDHDTVQIRQAPSDRRSVEPCYLDRRSPGARPECASGRCGLGRGIQHAS